MSSNDLHNLAVRVIPRAKENSVMAKNGGLVVHVTASPEKGKANAAALKLVAEHLGLPVSSLHIVRGATARKKTVAIY